MSLPVPDCNYNMIDISRTSSLTMEWQPIGVDTLGPLALLVQPLLRIVRDLSILQRQERVSGPLPQTQLAPVAVEDVVAKHVSKRKRSAFCQPDEVDSMRPPKRQRFDIESPWEKEGWIREHLRDMQPPPRIPYRTFMTPESTPQPVRTRPKQYSSPRLLPYSRAAKPSPRKIDIHLTKTPPQTLPFLWSDEDDDDDNNESLGREADRQINQTTLTSLDTTENDSPDQDFMPIRPSLLQVTTPPSISESNSDSQEPDDLFNMEEEKEFRAYLRARPDSYDDMGYKTAIDGVISPDSQAWNDDHRQKLLESSTAAQKTPSKVLESSSTPSTPGSFPEEEEKVKLESLPEEKVKLDEVVVTPRSSPRNLEKLEPKPVREQRPARSEIQESVKKEESDNAVDEKLSDASVGQTESPRLMATEQENKPSSITTPKSHELQPRQVQPQQDDFENPLAQLTNLHIGSARSSTRTPKASTFSDLRTVRKTRYQEALEKREAAKDAYRIVPLSQGWDDRVRNAVRNGSADQRYASTDFARVVPQYSAQRGQDNWLNDSVINDYIALCVKHGNRDDRPTQVPTNACFSSFMYTKIAADPTSLPARWAKRAAIPGKKIMECEKIFIPINSGMHWTLCVIEPKLKKRITIYNSMGSARGQQVGETFLAWLKHEVGASFDESGWTINSKGTSPQQRNADDCGVFTITTARQIMLDRMEKTPYTPDMIPVQRKRIVAELVNGDLLKAEES